uniref:Uncharacterized protein n=1 Tax=Setaria italica TaxID=4555 RepID=K3XUK8_SETIT
MGLDEYHNLKILRKKECSASAKFMSKSLNNIYNMSNSW